MVVKLCNIGVDVFDELVDWVLLLWDDVVICGLIDWIGFCD